jgi:hypothetical protein
MMPARRAAKGAAAAAEAADGPASAGTKPVGRPQAGSPGTDPGAKGGRGLVCHSRAGSAGNRCAKRAANARFSRTCRCQPGSRPRPPVRAIPLVVSSEALRPQARPGTAAQSRREAEAGWSRWLQPPRRPRRGKTRLQPAVRPSRHGSLCLCKLHGAEQK